MYWLTMVCAIVVAICGSPAVYVTVKISGPEGMTSVELAMVAKTWSSTWESVSSPAGPARPTRRARWVLMPPDPWAEAALIAPNSGLRLPTLASKYFVSMSSVSTPACSWAGVRYGLSLGSGTSVCFSTQTRTDDEYVGGWMKTQPVAPTSTSTTGPRSSRRWRKNVSSRRTIEAQCGIAALRQGMGGRGRHPVQCPGLQWGLRPGRIGRMARDGAGGPFRSRRAAGTLRPGHHMARMRNARTRNLLIGG